MAFVLTSFLFKRQAGIWIFNMIGSAFGVAYGAMILAIPVICLNSAVIVLNTVQLIRLRKGGKNAELSGH